MSAELADLTDEGAQELPDRKDMKAAELLREVGCVLRLSEAQAEDGPTPIAAASSSTSRASAPTW
jgi:hypothetical protein